MIRQQFAHPNAGGADDTTPGALQIIAFQKNTKLIPTEPRDKVSRPIGRHHSIGHLNQQRIPNFMAIGVNHRFELIQIHTKHRVRFDAFMAVYALHEVPARLRWSEIIKINIARELRVRQTQSVNPVAHSAVLQATATKLIK